MRHLELSFDYEVYEPTRHDNHLDDIFAFDQPSHLLIFAGRRFQSSVVDVDETDVLWAWVLYNRISNFARLLDRFRKALSDTAQKMTVDDLRGFLEKLVSDAKNVGRRDNRLDVLPAIFMEALIEESSGGSQNVLMEVVLYDRTDSTKELSYIPIHSSGALPA